MKAQKVSYQRAASTVFGAMQRASLEVQQHRDAEGTRPPAIAATATKHARGSLTPAQASSTAFLMPCLAQLATRDALPLRGAAVVAAEVATGALPARTEDGRLPLSQLCDLVDACRRVSDLSVVRRAPNVAPKAREDVVARAEAVEVDDDIDVTDDINAVDVRGEQAALAEALFEALEGYNPTLDARLVERVAQRVDVALALEQAQHLLDLAHQSQHSGDAPTDSARHDAFVTLLGRWRAEREARAAPAESLDSAPAHAKSRAAARAASERAAEAAAWRLAEEEAGIVARLHLGQGTNRQRLAGVLKDVGDVQVSEVLPGGQVVTFTRATMPEDETAVEWKGKHRHNLVASLEALFAPAESADTAPRRAVYLHFIVHKHDVPLAELFRFLTAVIGDDLVQPRDFAVSQVLEERAVTVQTCVLRVVVPEAVCAVDGGAVEYCRHIARRLMEVNVVAAHHGVAGEAPPREKAAAGLREAPVALQLLEWLPSRPTTHARKLPLSPSSSSSAEAAPSGGGAQYMFLVRGVRPPRGAPPSYLESVVQRSLAAMPNFFGPVHFGPVGVACPFRTFHVSAALARGRWAEALMMAVVLGWWPTASSPAPTTAEFAAPWTAAVFDALSAGEDRAAVLQALWTTHVPPAVQAHFAGAGAALVWNVLASCRLQEWKQHKTGTQAGLLDADRAMAGDFVRVDDATLAGQVPRRKSECVLAVPALATDAADHTHDAEGLDTPRVRPLLTVADGPAPPVTRVVVPLAEDNAQLARSPALHALAVALGVLPLAREAGRAGAGRRAAASGVAVPLFRPLLLQGSGYPQAARPGVKAFAEPSRASPDTAPAAPALYRLATDVALAGAGDGGGSGDRRDFAAVSRGRQGAVWPLGQRGRGMVERLPTGLLAATAATHTTAASRRPRERAASSSSSSWCLVVHVTLPAAAYSGNFLRECLALRDQRQPLRRPLDELARRLALDGGASGRVEAVARAVPAVPAPPSTRGEVEDAVDGNLLFPRRRGGASR